MTEILTDRDLIFYMPDWVCAPDEPVWRNIMAIAMKADQIGEFEGGVRPIIDEHDRIVAIEMPNPAYNGVPSEAVLNSLRGLGMEERDISDLIDSFTEFESTREPTREVELPGMFVEGSE